jgi:hypothetical protein
MLLLFDQQAVWIWIGGVRSLEEDEEEGVDEDEIYNSQTPLFWCHLVSHFFFLITR